MPARYQICYRDRLIGELRGPFPETIYPWYFFAEEFELLLWAAREGDEVKTLLMTMIAIQSQQDRSQN